MKIESILILFSNLLRLGKADFSTLNSRPVPNILFNSFNVSPDIIKDFGSQCKTHLEVLQAKLKSRFSEPKGIWAIKMLDASGQFPDGLLIGNVFALGNYGSCLDIDVPNFNWKGNQTEGFKGRYTQTFIMPLPSNTTLSTDREFQLNFNPVKEWKMMFPVEGHKLMARDSSSSSGFSIHYGMCLPSSCTDEEMWEVLQNLIDTVPQLSQLGLKIVFGFPSHSKADQWHFDGLDIFMITLVSVLSLAIIGGTSLEAWYLYNGDDLKNKSQNFATALLLGCSVYRNSKVLLSITKKSSANKEHLSCINGIRFLSMSWVVLGHVYSNFLGILPVNNLVIFGPKLTNDFAARAILNAFLSVDSFFLLSGCLVAYLTLKELDKTKGKMNLIMYYVHRYLRLTGMYAFLVLFHMTLYRGFEGGPNSTIKIEIDNCRKAWWRNLLYINNFNYRDHYGVETFDEICLGHSWYLSNDMQMFIVAPIFIYALWFSNLWGLILVGCTTFASVLVPLYLTVVNDWPATPTFNVDPASTYMTSNYILPWCRFSPYIIGISLGYILHSTKNKPFKMSKEVNVICWGLATALGIAVVYGMDFSVLLLGQTPSKLTNAFYGGFHRFAWGVALAWVVFACSRGYGGWINTFLSWEAFEPLGKLCYNIYLVHLSIQGVITANNSFTISLSNFLGIVMFLTLLVYSTLISAVLFVCVEVPWANTETTIFSFILRRNSKPKSN